MKSYDPSRYEETQHIEGKRMNFKKIQLNLISQEDKLRFFLVATSGKNWGFKDPKSRECYLECKV